MGCSSFIKVYTEPYPVVIFPAREDCTFYTVAEVLETRNKLDPELVLILIKALKHCLVVKLMNETDYDKLWDSDNFTITRYVI